MTFRPRISIQQRGDGTYWWCMRLAGYVEGALYHHAPVTRTSLASVMSTYLLYLRSTRHLIKERP